MPTLTSSTVCNLREEDAERIVQAVQNAVVHMPDEDRRAVGPGAGQEGGDDNVRDGAAEQEVLIPLRQRHSMRCCE